MDNETWIIETGDQVIQMKAKNGFNSLTSWEKLVYCLWVADYGMRNAGDLDASYDLFADFHSLARQLAKDLNLSSTHAAFSLPKNDLERVYFDKFDSTCNEIRSVEKKL